MIKILELFSFLILFLSFLTVCATNPIYAIMFLILIFCNAGLILFFFNFDFFGLIFIIIYVGAIAVLFLFVIMMLNDNLFFVIDKINNINVFWQYFYNFFNIFFIISGIILLIALVGAVTLTIDTSILNKTAFKQIESKQIVKSSNVLSFIQN
jgi:NADH:ubiquinone oxidoreductase subunit 6 (subunit J)